MPWDTSDRRGRLPANWPTLRAACLRRDPICRCAGCKHCTPRGCTRRSTDADHIQRGDDHRLEALQGMCNPCHLAKNGRENAAFNYNRAAARKRPPEPHPGVIER